MVERGARYIILLSRNANSIDIKTSLWLQGLLQRGIQIHMETCDVASEDQLATSLKKLEAKLPSIKGVVQAAMVLRVGSSFRALSRKNH